jgi:hypothetical protein
MAIPRRKSITDTVKKAQIMTTSNTVEETTQQEQINQLDGE